MTNEISNPVNSTSRAFLPSAAQLRLDRSLSEDLISLQASELNNMGASKFAVDGLRLQLA
jgi:hypothetical protein